MGDIPDPRQILEARLAWISRNILRINDFAHGTPWQVSINNSVDHIRDEIRKTLDEHGTGLDLDLGDDDLGDDDAWDDGDFPPGWDGLAM